MKSPEVESGELPTNTGGELKIKHDGPICRITLSRPSRRNALSRALVAALHRAFTSIEEGDETRVVVLGGDGPAFCAGGDIVEYASAAESGQARAIAEGLADLLAAMTACPAPIVARVHGIAYGGGVGLVCASDVAIAADNTRFSLSEARLGLVPATIAPYVIAALGQREAKAQMLIAAPFGADDALRSGLIHQTLPPVDLDAAVDASVTNLLRSPPGALATIKRIPSQLGHLSPTDRRTATINLLEERLGSEEGREGLQAFLEKRSPAWMPASADPS